MSDTVKKQLEPGTIINIQVGDHVLCGVDPVTYKSTGKPQAFVVTTPHSPVTVVPTTDKAIITVVVDGWEIG
jgi:hypothetical protein